MTYAIMESIRQNTNQIAALEKRVTALEPKDVEPDVCICGRPDCKLGPEPTAPTCPCLNPECKHRSHYGPVTLSPTEANIVVGVLKALASRVPLDRNSEDLHEQVGNARAMLTPPDNRKRSR